MYKNFLGEAPSMPHHHMNPMEFAQVSNATAYARVNTKLTQHIENERMHITDEERDKWNKKADKTAVEQIKLDMLKKADSDNIPTLISQLKNDAVYITSDNLTSKLSSLDYITWAELKYKGYVTQDDLSKYAKKSDLSSYATTDSVADKATMDDVQNYINRLNLISAEDLNAYVKKEDIPHVITRDINVDTINAQTTTTQSLYAVESDLSNVLIHSLKLVDDSGSGVAYVLYIDQDGTVKANLSSPIQY